jgi:hypothetical protein
MSFCNCNYGLGNTGVPGCQTLQSVTKKLILVPINKADGTRNSIAIGDVIDAAYLTARINDADESARWYPTPLLDNVENTKADSLFESLNSGSNIFIQEGVRTFTGVFIKQGPTFLGKLKSGRCVSFGVYMIDIDGSLTGYLSNDGQELYPISVDKETFNPVLMPATDSTVAKIMLSFEFLRTQMDENLKSISAQDIAADVLSSNGLLDGFVAISADTTTDFTATVTSSYGSFNSPLRIEGLLLADFTVYNITTASAVVITSVTEVADGEYAVVIPAQTALDSMRLSIVKDGFLFEVATWTI